MKPYNRCYGFFDGVDVTNFCVPKLIEIEMLSGTFRVGENVQGRMPVRIARNKNAIARIDFRTASPTHISMDNLIAPSDEYTVNPYTKSSLPRITVDHLQH